MENQSINAFKYYRLLAGLKQNFVAKKLNIGQSTVAMWETNSSNPHAKNLIKLANLYKCTVGDLLSEGVATLYRRTGSLYQRTSIPWVARSSPPRKTITQKLNKRDKNKTNTTSAELRK